MTTITTKMIMMKTSRSYYTNSLLVLQRVQQQQQLQLKQRCHVRFLSSMNNSNSNVIMIQKEQNNANNNQNQNQQHQQQRRIAIQQKQHHTIYNNNNLINIRSSSSSNNNNNHRRYLSSYPSHQLVGLPSLSPTMESGTIASWNVNVGDMYHPGDSLCSIETDKATVDFEAQDDGYVAKILVDAATGIDIPVGSPIMITVEDINDIAAFTNYVVADGSGASAAAVVKELSILPPPETVVAVTPTVVDVLTSSTTTSTTTYQIVKEMGCDGNWMYKIECSTKYF